MYKFKLGLGGRKMNNNSESNTDIVDAISEGITDDIPCGNITDEVNIDRCIDNMDNT